jgi:hypothetical protein
MLRCTTSLLCLFTRLDRLQLMRNQLHASQYLVLVLRLVVFIRFDIGTRSAVARKLLLYDRMFAHAFMKKAKQLPPWR